MLKKDITDERKERHAVTQEDFTPLSVIEDLFEYADEELFSNFDKTYLDTSAGTGNILCEILKKRLNYCDNVDDGFKAVHTLFGIELIEDNANECRDRLKNIFDAEFHVYNEDALNRLLNHNIICADTLTYDFGKLELINIY